MASHNCAVEGEIDEESGWWVCSECGDEYASREIAHQVSSENV